MTLSQEIFNILKKILNKKNVLLHEPIFYNNELKYLKKCINTKMVSSIGSYVDLFENKIAKFTGSKYAIATVNGTSALHLALILCEIKKNDEVIIPALTFVATASAVVNSGGIPHFVDSNEKNFGIDHISLRKYLEGITLMRDNKCFNKKTGRRIHSILPTHIFGHPCELKELKKIAKDFNLIFIEDAAEALGSYYNGKHVGSNSILSVLSFNGNKTITTGGGGAILTNNKQIAKKAKHLSTTAKVKHSWEFIHDEIGFNYRMPNINAAVGCAQLENIKQILFNKRKLFNIYNKEFAKVKGVKLISEPKKCNSNYWLQTLLFDSDSISEREKLLKISNNYGIQTRPIWRLIPNLTPYSHFPSSPLPISQSLEKRILNIPSNIILS